MSHNLTPSLNREERRKLTRKDLEEAQESTQDNLASILLSVWVDVIWDDVEPEAVEDWVNKVVDKYNSMPSKEWPEYQKKVYRRTGMGILRTEELARM